MDSESANNTPMDPLGGQLDRFMQARRIDARSGVKTIDICGVPINSLSLRGVLRSVCVQISQRLPGYIVTPNIDHVCRYQTNEEFRNAYRDALLSLPDSTPLLWAGRILNTPLREKLSGSDLIYHLSKFAADNGFCVYLMGAAEGVAAEAARRLAALYPGLVIAGTDSPPPGFEKDPALNGEVVQRLADSGADICFIALGSPKQEIWMHQNSGRSRVPVMIGVGASFDFVAGRVKRAPVWMQRTGLEWFWRLCHEPRRLWRRYLIYDTLFFWLLGRHIATRFRARLKCALGG
ncbi:MAG: WecB/TagA/CpsF family glycosyltransferase [Candidatus Hydrogenedentes bacterium]|nr:WecB/TagA/CpsF family glycosyltransferase [Candidatus Hydrogenedentota bacterium]